MACKDEDSSSHGRMSVSNVSTLASWAAKRAVPAGKEASGFWGGAGRGVIVARVG